MCGRGASTVLNGPGMQRTVTGQTRLVVVAVRLVSLLGILLCLAWLFGLHLPTPASLVAPTQLLLQRWVLWPGPDIKTASL